MERGRGGEGEGVTGWRGRRRGGRGSDGMERRGGEGERVTGWRGGRGGEGRKGGEERKKEGRGLV